MSRKIIAILLLFIWIFHCVFLCLFYQIGRWQCHAENFSKYKKNKSDIEIDYFTFTKHEKIDWEEEGKELSVNGKLYDVLELSENDSLITVKCFADKKEDNIKLAFHKYLKGDPHHNDKNKPIKKITDFKYLKYEEDDFNLSILYYTKSVFYRANTCTKYIEETFPPPEC